MIHDLANAAYSSGGDHELPLMNIDRDIIDGPIARAQGINTTVQAVRDIVEALPSELRVIGLDAEWTVSTRQGGVIGGPSSVDVITLSYVHTACRDGSLGYRVLVLKVTGEPV